jgi:hypothetical protein
MGSDESNGRSEDQLRSRVCSLLPSSSSSAVELRPPGPLLELRPPTGPLLELSDWSRSDSEADSLDPKLIDNLRKQIVCC